MFSAEHQTGSRGLEILSPIGTGKDEKWCKFVGGVTREYEREVRGYMYLIDKGNNTYIQCPASNRHSLGIKQPLLVIQLQSLPESNLNIEVVVLDMAGRRHRLRFSSNLRRFESNNLHAQIPWYIGDVTPGSWTQVIFDLEFLTDRCFDGARFMSLDSFSLRPCMKVRNIFSLPMRAVRRSSSGGGDNYDNNSELTVPKALQFAAGVHYETKFFDESIDYAFIAAPATSLRQASTASETASITTKGVKSASRTHKLSVNGVPIQKQVKKTGSEGHDMYSSMDTEQVANTAQHARKSSTANHKSGKTATASRREKTAAKIKLMKQQREEEELKLNKQHRKLTTSQLSPSLDGAKRKVAIKKNKSKNRKISSGSTAQGRMYEALDDSSPPQSPQQREGRQKFSSSSYPNKTRPIPILPKRSKHAGGKVTDSSLELDRSEVSEVDGAEVRNVVFGEKNVTEDPITSTHEHNPWKGGNSPRRDEARASKHEGAPTSVFSRLDASSPVEAYGGEDPWLKTATDHLNALTNELSIAERDYMIEFGESPPKK